LLLVKFAFLQLRVELVFPESLQDLADMFHMLFQRVREDQDVHIVEAVVHEVLKGCWGVTQAEQHDQVFEAAIARSECRLPFVARSDPDEVV
ncbi:hypothetical protein BOTBODRAFT_97447, partial [Botryobasidium botryosum FD-172 SS1]